ncbi:MAG: L-2-amino-thiazoline-4-carboxylic acid hydrolase [bacterium]|nr:L-2-amino-thiazoline-4-carboxylic acid hydrolase [bacterium]
MWKVLYSRHAKRVLCDWIKKEYGSESGKVWDEVQRQYIAFLKDAPDFGGKKSPHSVQIYDSILLFAYCTAEPKKHSPEELQPVSFEIFMASFRTLGKIFNANRKRTMNLLGLIFKAAIEKTNRHAVKYADDFAAVLQPYDRKSGIVRYSFTQCPVAEFAKKHGLTEWMPLMCNCDYMALSHIRAGLIRTGTCTESGECDYLVCGDENPVMNQYEQIKEETGLIVSRKKQR